MDDIWQKLVEEIGKSPVVAAWFTAAGVVLAALVSALVSYAVSQRSVYINAVTAERSKWIEALRGTIAAYSGAAGKVIARRGQSAKYEASADWAVDTEALRRLLSDSVLRLNPSEPEALNLLRAARKLDQAARIHRPMDFELASELMVRHAQWVLKAEWERVKEEASWWLARPVFAYRNWRRSRMYARFLAGDGQLARLDLIGAGEQEAVVSLARSSMDTRPPSHPNSCLAGNRRWLGGLRLPGLYRPSGPNQRP